MAYVKILYQDSPSTATPLNAQNLNHMDDGIAENDRRLNELSTAGVVNTFNSRTGNVTSEKGDYDINQIVASDGQDGYIPVWRNNGTEQEPDWGFAMEEMGGSGGIFYGTCTGEEANQIKAVTVSNEQNFKLKAGSILAVKFDADNTYSATSAAPVKLNVNSTGAKNIYYGATNAPTGTNTTPFGRANYVNQYYYDGTNWVWSGSSADNNTTYSNMSASELTTGTATTARSISAKVLKDWNTAAHTTYDPTTSGLSATKVQEAIDEVAKPTFTEASTRANIASGESISTLFGKIKKFFTDIKDLAFIAKDGSTSKYLCGDGTWKAFSKSTVGLGNVDNTADNNKPVPIVECSTARSTANKAVALTGFTLKTGSRVYVRFTDTGTSNPASGNLTLNVNSTGAKTIVDGKTNKSVLTYSSAGWFYNNIVSEFVYDGTYWVWMSRDNNTTYTPQGLGFGYATCSTAAATAAKVATLSGYSLVTNGIVSVKFTNSVPTNSTLNINNKGAKNIYYQGAKIVAGVIKAGDIATFVYSGNYNLICIDRGSAENVVYDNSQSGLSATKVQGAIDEVKGAIDNIADSGIWRHTVTATEAADSTIYVSPQAIKAGAKKIIPTGCSAGGTLKPCVYHNNSGYFIIYGMTSNEEISIFYVAIM